MSHYGQPPQGPGYPGQEPTYPGPSAPGYGPAEPTSISAKGFLESLFDFRFESFVTPKVVKVVYIIVMALIGLSALGFLVFAFRANVIFGIISLLILCPLFFFFELALWRIVLELTIIIFRIADDLRAIRERR